MTKKIENQLSTEEKIVKTALKMFNEAGIEYVGMRELAAALDMRVGNLTYYYPTKDDLVNRLSLDLARENDRTIVPMTQVTMQAFFDMLVQVFRNQAKYRCLMLSFVHVMQRNPIIAKRYSKTQSARNEAWVKNIQALKEGKYISANDSEVDFLVSTIALIARFWVSEAAVSFRNLADEQQMNHYIRMIARIFVPYATAKGRPHLDEMLNRQTG